MMHALASIAGGILLALSAIHWYWMAGGRAGAAAAIPSGEAGPAFRPTPVATGIVAALLALAGWLVLELGEVAPRLLFPGWMLGFGGFALSGVFIVRAVGDFRWMGFFKRRRDTLFAKYDTMLYSPLCLFIGICVMLVAIN